MACFFPHGDLDFFFFILAILLNSPVNLSEPTTSVCSHFIPNICCFYLMIWNEEIDVEAPILHLASDTKDRCKFFCGVAWLCTGYAFAT